MSSINGASLSETIRLDKFCDVVCVVDQVIQILPLTSVPTEDLSIIKYRTFETNLRLSEVARAFKVMYSFKNEEYRELVEF